MRGWLPVEASADVCGTAAWLADMLFRVEGEWSGHEGHPDVRVHWALWSRRHGEHAGAWRDLLPTSPQLRPDERVRVVDGWIAAADRLAGLGPDDTATRLAVTARVVLPRLSAGIASVVVRCGDVADAPMLRVARRHLADLHDETDRAWVLSQGLRGDVDDGVVGSVEADLGPVGLPGGDA